MWLILPQPSVAEVLRNPGARTWIADKLLTKVVTPFIVETPPVSGSIGRFTSTDDHTNLLGLWNRQERKIIKISGTPLLSIWIDVDDSTIGSIDEARSEALERICQLSQRLWYNLSIPDFWKPRKVDGYHTIRAGDRRLEDIFVAYEVRTESGRRVIDIGSFYGRRHQKLLTVSPIEPFRLSRLPESFEVPDEREVPSYSAKQHSHTAPDDGDLVMGVPAGESRHLFSLRYSDWVGDNGPLTKQQRRVIDHKIERPLRVHGPAGSGKTLILVLKALRLLREAQNDAKVCHALVVLNSNAVRATVRAAIDAIDDCGFMATTRNDPQFIDVDTLHGWCIRELGLEDGPRYVLETDPIVSKEQQHEILQSALSDSIESKYRASQKLLSQDFITRIEGNRAQLLRDLAWEIAIRIKGRGFRKGDQKLYTDSPMRSFIGRSENSFDRHFIFHIYQKYEEHFEKLGLLDTDDVVLSMAARLATSLWDRQRRSLGYDYVLVDETHLFNENERRVLPYLTRGSTDYLPLVMTFDEAQSIGGRRSSDLDVVGIEHSERRTLRYIHRSSPDILALARDLVERSPLVFSEFDTSEPVAAMPKNELKRCRKPTVAFANGDEQVVQLVSRYCSDFRSHNYQRVGVIAFDAMLLQLLRNQRDELGGEMTFVRERGELLAALPKPGVYLMIPETCGGLEFDAVLLVGVDEGRVPPPMGDLSSQGYLSVQEEAFKELYTAVTRARYALVFACDGRRGLSSLIKPALISHLVEETFLKS